MTCIDCGAPDGSAIQTTGGTGNTTATMTGDVNVDAPGIIKGEVCTPEGIVEVHYEYIDGVPTLIGYVDHDGSMMLGALPPVIVDCRPPTVCDQCFIDDDGAGTLVEFIRRIETTVDYSGNVQTTTIVGDFETDGTTPYTVVGTATPCAEVGAAPSVVEAHRETLVGAITWGPPPGLVTGLTYTAISGSGAAGTVPNPAGTITDHNGTVSTLFEGESVTWNADDGLPLSTGSINVEAGAIVNVHFSTLA